MSVIIVVGVSKYLITKVGIVQGTSSLNRHSPGNLITK